MSLQVSTHKKQAVLDTANGLLKAQNRVTTLEIKTALRANTAYSGYYWDQNIVSTIMIELQKEGKFDFVDTGVYRIYTGKAAVTTTPAAGQPKRGVGRPRKNPVAVAKPTPVKKAAKSRTINTTGAPYISRTKAFNLMSNNKGRFFTAVFVKKNKNGVTGGERTMNCQYLKDQTPALGYVKVKDAALVRTGATNVIRSVNLQTLKALSIGGQVYRIR